MQTRRRMKGKPKEVLFCTQKRWITGLSLDWSNKLYIKCS